MPVVIDARQMEPPEPFEKTMAALDDLAPGDEIVLVLNREPAPLYRVLDANGYAHRVEWFDDGRCEIHIRRAP